MIHKDGHYGTRQKRIRDNGDGLTDDERKLAIGLSSSRSKAARMLGVSLETLQELLTPYGRVQPKTLARIRTRMANLKSVST